jgi:O-6-methylguanine DNA methyltransferase
VRGDTDFTRRVIAAIRRIPPGCVASYGEIAAVAGRPRACRAVGNILRDTRAQGLPAHRVIAAKGALGGFGGNLPLKRALLAREGVLVRGNRVVDWRERTWPARPEPGEARRGGTARRRL